MKRLILHKHNDSYSIQNFHINKQGKLNEKIFGSGGESLIKSKKTSTYFMFEINKERFGGSWFSVTHPHDQIFSIQKKDKRT